MTNLWHSFHFQVFVLSVLATLIVGLGLFVIHRLKKAFRESNEQFEKTRRMLLEAEGYKKALKPGDFPVEGMATVNNEENIIEKIEPEIIESEGPEKDSDTAGEGNDNSLPGEEIG